MNSPSLHRAALLRTLAEWHSCTLPLGPFFYQELFSNTLFEDWCRANSISFEYIPDRTGEFKVPRLVVLKAYVPLKESPDKEL